ILTNLNTHQGGFTSSTPGTSSIPSDSSILSPALFNYSDVSETEHPSFILAFKSTTPTKNRTYSQGCCAATSESCVPYSGSYLSTIYLLILPDFTTSIIQLMIVLNPSPIGFRGNSWHQ